ncbi:hypothetical protein P375_05915 [Gallibacterium genomosp. 2]|uniref:Uncharacterized protein n=1 Tax=Gallibacterium genomosp. 2 TaxID=155517 RepID=A0A0A2Y4C7_9PAST|nr:hypothetical protein [Gallibacterium genomosp. 2]KGQ32329.1 hypothetical protein P375_05915 [Gallibacterium genomosp. 2]
MKRLEWLTCALTETPILLANGQHIIVKIDNNFNERGFISVGYFAEVITPNSSVMIMEWNRYGDSEDLSEYDFKQPSNKNSLFKSKLSELENIWKDNNDLELTGKNRTETLVKTVMTNRFG